MPGDIFTTAESVLPEQAPDQQAEKRLRDLVERMPVMVDAFDEHGQIVFWNRECERVSGYSAAEIVRNPRAMELLYPDPEYLQRKMAEWRQRGDHRDWEWDLACKNGDRRRIAWSNVSLERPIAGWATWGIGVDVTERHRAESALRESEARLRLAQRIGGVGSWYLNLGDESVSWSDECIRIFGHDPATFVPTNDAFYAMLHPDDVPLVRRLTHTARTEAVPYEVDHRIILASGEVRWVNEQADVVSDHAGRPVRLVGSIRDITEKRRAQETLLAAQERLLEQRRNEQQRVEAELARVRHELVAKTRLAAIGQVSASIAHELRNPLGAVRNAAYFLKRRVAALDPMLVEYIDIIDQEIGTSDRIISNLLEMSRAKPPTRQWVDLAGVVRETLIKLGAAAAVSFDVRLKPDPYEIYVDPAQMRQILGNLFANSIQAMGGSGRVSVLASRSESLDIIVVRDSGPGIAPDVRPQLFEPLFTTKAKGTGLGLTICRQILERHGGTIDLLDDSPGASFRICIPRPGDDLSGPASGP